MEIIRLIFSFEYEQRFVLDDRNQLFTRISLYDPRKSMLRPGRWAGMQMDNFTTVARILPFYPEITPVTHMYMIVQKTLTDNTVDYVYFVYNDSMDGYVHRQTQYQHEGARIHSIQIRNRAVSHDQDFDERMVRDDYWTHGSYSSNPVDEFYGMFYSYIYP
jgi:hypothetical protein